MNEKDFKYDVAFSFVADDKEIEKYLGKMI